MFIREVLQNATDAITARKELGETAAESKGFEGKVTVELSGSGEQQVLMIQDNGIGLSEEDIHRFLSIIGTSLRRRGQIYWPRRHHLSGDLGLACCLALW